METQYAEATTEDIIRKRIDASNRHDVNAALALYSPDIVRYGTMQPQEGARGKEALRTDIEENHSAFPDSHIKILNLVAKGDMVALEYEFTGTHRGTIQTPAGPIPPTNKVLKGRGAGFGRVSRGLIVEESVYYDTAEMMRQLGLSPQK